MKIRNLAPLLSALILVCALALVVTWYASREFKESLLERETISDAVRWAEFVASQSPKINEELSLGHISRHTDAALKLASRAGGIFRYKLFNRDGIVVHASRLDDVGDLNIKPYFETLVRKGETFAKIAKDEKFGMDKSIVGEAYVPIMENGRFLGAIEVYVDATDTAARFDQVARYAFWGITVLMMGVALCWTFFVWRDLQSRTRLQEEITANRNHLQELVNSATQELKENAEELEQALAKEQELNKLQREFVTMASHEFRTPLAIIDGTAQRMKSRINKNRLTPEDAVHRIEKIRAAVNRMTRLMRSTLDVTRMKEGKIEVEIGPCDVGKVIREVCLHQQEISQTHVISCDLADLPVTIQADTSSLEQMLVNLLSNAVKYSPDALGIEVKARTQGAYVVISIRDQGIGIDQEDLPRIGELFFRAKTSTGIVGTGIGLNLAKALAEMHDGSVAFVSQKGEGSTFTLSLPISGPDMSEQAKTKAA